MIEAVGEIGYTGSNIHAHSYDWRLSPEQLEKTRRLFHKVEEANRRHARDEPGRRENRVVGALVRRYFIAIFF